MSEVWKVVDGTSGMLEVSNLGRVRSNLRDGRTLKQQADNKGYQRIRVTIKREKMCFKVHRIVAAAFIPNPDMLPQVNHIDGDKNNNRADNLEWVTNAQNAHHAMRTGLWENVFSASSSVNEKRKTPIIAVNCKTGEKRRFDSVSDAERFYGTRHICAVMKGERKKAAGHRFYREEVV